MKIRVWNIPVEVYKVGLSVFVGDTVRGCMALANKGEDFDEDLVENADGKGFAFHAENKKGEDRMVIMLSVSKDKNTYVDAGLIVHECVHMAWFILDRAAVKLDGNNHEAQTYLIEYLVRAICDKVSADRVLRIKIAMDL